MSENNDIRKDIDNLIDTLKSIKSYALKEETTDFLKPTRFYINSDFALELIYNIVNFSRKLQFDIMALRRFASFSAIRSEVYTELYYTRAYLHKMLLSLLYDPNNKQWYFVGHLRYGNMKFKLLKHKMLREIDALIEYLADYIEFREIFDPTETDIDANMIYVVWKDSTKNIPTHDDIKLVYADSPEGVILTDTFMIKKFPAVVYPAGGLIIQGVKKINYAIRTVRNSIKMDKFIDSKRFQRVKDSLTDILSKSHTLIEEIGADELDYDNVLELFRVTKRRMPIVKRILSIEMGGFAKANTDLFTSVSALCYVASEKTISTIAMSNFPIMISDLQDIYILSLMVSETLGILDFLKQYRPPDVNPPFYNVIVVGHSKCSHCHTLYNSIKNSGILGITDDIRIDFIDGLQDPERAAQFYQYVVVDEQLQTMDSPLAYYGLVAINPTPDAETMLIELDEELYEKLKKRIKQAKAIEIIASGRRGRRTEAEGSTSTDVWQYGSRKIKLNYAVKFLRDAGFAWHKLSTIIGFFYGKQYSDSVLRKIYREFENENNEKEEKEETEK